MPAARSAASTSRSATGTIRVAISAKSPLAQVACCLLHGRRDRAGPWSSCSVVSFSSTNGRAGSREYTTGRANLSSMSEQTTAGRAPRARRSDGEHSARRSSSRRRASRRSRASKGCRSRGSPTTSECPRAGSSRTSARRRSSSSRRSRPRGASSTRSSSHRPAAPTASRGSGPHRRLPAARRGRRVPGRLLLRLGRRRARPHPGPVRDSALVVLATGGAAREALGDAQAEGKIIRPRTPTQLAFEVNAYLLLANAQFVISPVDSRRDSTRARDAPRELRPRPPASGRGRPRQSVPTRRPASGARRRRSVPGRNPESGSPSRGDRLLRGGTTTIAERHLALLTVSPACRRRRHSNTGQLRRPGPQQFDGGPPSISTR